MDHEKRPTYMGKMERQAKKRSKNFRRFRFLLFSLMAFFV
jgi:hypothetical protein